MISYNKQINGITFDFSYFNSTSNLNLISNEYYITISVEYIPSQNQVTQSQGRGFIQLCMPDIMNEINHIIQTNIGFYNQFDVNNMIVHQPTEATLTPLNSYTTYLISSKINVGMKCK